MSLLFIGGLTLSVAAGAAGPGAHATPYAPPPSLDVLAFAGFMLAVIQLACFAQ